MVGTEYDWLSAFDYLSLEKLVASAQSTNSQFKLFNSQQSSTIDVLTLMSLCNLALSLAHSQASE